MREDSLYAFELASTCCDGRKTLVLQYRGNISVHILRVLVSTHARGRAEKGLSALCATRLRACCTWKKAQGRSQCVDIMFIVPRIYAQGWSG